MQPKTDQYYEIESTHDISHFLQEERLVTTGKPSFLSLAELESSQFVRAFAAFETSRTKYLIDDIVVDLDEADFGYSIGELEIVVDSSNEASVAERKIRDLAQRLNLDMMGVVRGKLIEYILRHDAAHYEALRVSGVLREEKK
jgi:thiamine-triphosphatase